MEVMATLFQGGGVARYSFNSYVGPCPGKSTLKTGPGSWGTGEIGSDSQQRRLLIGLPFQWMPHLAWMFASAGSGCRAIPGSSWPEEFSPFPAQSPHFLHTSRELRSIKRHGDYVSPLTAHVI